MRVFRDYDQAGLDAQYNLRRRVPEHPEFIARWAAESAMARRALPCRLDLRYGDGPLETLDVFPAAHAGAPLLVFIHGGYWRTLDKGDFSLLAPAWTAAGVTLVSIDYPLAPAAALDDIVAACRRAVDWVRRHARDLGGDPAALHLAGHSAGAHLAAMVMTEQPVAGACLLSGVYELEPVRLTPYVNDDLRLDAAAAARNSPIALRPAAPCPLLVAVGADETDEFVRQSRDMAAAWSAETCLELPGRHHFSAVDALADGDDPLFGAVLDLIDGRRPPG